MAGRPHIEIKKHIHPQIAQMYADLTEPKNNLRKSAKSVDQKSILLTRMNRIHRIAGAAC